ncbi:MAG: ATP-binding protein [Bacteroidales bacterium]|jgi:predicted ATPase|nr:ATP-binding protein [Bacteroidales bacterium]
MKIKIKNFGHLSGSNDFIEIKPVTVFCGEQGSGKSTILKLVSMFSWLEKALHREDVPQKFVQQYERFKKTFCSYHNIQSYFRDDTEIEFEGNIFKFSYKNKKIEITDLKNPEARIAQVMYIPSERNLIGAIEDTEKIKRLPPALLTMIEEYYHAARSIGNMKLPFGNYEFKYDKLNKVSSLAGENFKIKLNEAASGFQSSIPLLLVTRYLVDKTNQDNNADVSAEEMERIRKKINQLLIDKTLDKSVQRLLSSKLRAMLHNNDYFLNIVEEPEQNLYPTTQRQILNELLAAKNRGKDKENMLLFSTHSPYMISYLSLAIKAAELKATELSTELNDIVPLESCVSSEKVAIYQINDKGQVSLLEEEYNLPSDNNYLNDNLGDINDLFDKLLDIEDKCL